MYLRHLNFFIFFKKFSFYIRGYKFMHVSYFGPQRHGVLGKDFPLLHISHHGLHQLELQKLSPQVDPLEVTLLLDLLRKLLVQHLPQNHHMKGVPYYLRGTHQASSHQQQTLLLEDVHSQVFKGYWYLSMVLMAFAVFNK